MYAAQATAASPTHASPTASSAPAPNGLASSRMPATASATHTRSSGRRESATATLTGPMNSIVTAAPSGMRSSAS